MQEKYNAPTNRSVIGSKWVYKVKKNPDGSNMYAVGI